MIEQHRLSGAVEADFGFISDDEILDRLSDCDLLCFAYGQSTESATGAARMALAADRPLLCSQSSVLRDLLPYSLALARLDAASIAEALIVLAMHPELRSLRDKERRSYVAEHSYEAVANRYSRILGNMVRDKSNVQ